MKPKLKTTAVLFPSKPQASQGRTSLQRIKEDIKRRSLRVLLSPLPHFPHFKTRLILTPKSPLVRVKRTARQGVKSRKISLNSVNKFPSRDVVVELEKLPCDKAPLENEVSKVNAEEPVRINENDRRSPVRFPPVRDITILLEKLSPTITQRFEPKQMDEVPCTSTVVSDKELALESPPNDTQVSRIAFDPSKHAPLREKRILLDKLPDTHFAPETETTHSVEPVTESVAVPQPDDMVVASLAVSPIVPKMPLKPPSRSRTSKSKKPYAKSFLNRGRLMTKQSLASSSSSVGEKSRSSSVGTSLHEIEKKNAVSITSTVVSYNNLPDTYLAPETETTHSVEPDTENVKVPQPEEQDNEDGSKRRKIDYHCPPNRSMKDRFTGIMKKQYFVDKTMFIEELIRNQFQGEDELFPVLGTEIVVDPVLFTAPRRFGKTTILHMLDAFFSGTIPKDKLENLRISTSESAMKWYGKFAVIHLSFGSAGGSIDSKDTAMSACRAIIRAAYKDYSYIIPSLNKRNAKKFRSWFNDNKFIKKDIQQITEAIHFLVDGILLHYNYQKKCIILVDEFDRLSSRALFNCNSQQLREIVDMYSDMLGFALKHASGASWCYGIFTGVASITSEAASSLNNIAVISALRHEKFGKFYGFTLEEFENVLKRPDVPMEVKKWKDYAIQYYNGYRVGSVSLLNTYSVKQFIESGTKPTAFWKESGVALGLSRALRFREWRKIIMRLVTGDRVAMTFVKSINVTEFENFDNPCFELIKFNTILNLLYQQGYLCITAEDKKNEVSTKQLPNVSVQEVSLTDVETEQEEVQRDLGTDENVFVKMPNLEVEQEFRKQLDVSLVCTFKFDQISMRQCAYALLKMNMSSDKSCQEALKIVKTLINATLNSIKKKDINESWFENFLFHVFIEHFIIRTQEKIPESVGRKADQKKAKIYDMYVQAEDRCFIFEESCKDNTEKTLNKMIEKLYWKPAQKTGLPFLLIAFSLTADKRGYAHVNIRFLRHATKGKGIEV